MGLLDVHAEGIDAGIQRQLRNPGPPPPERDFSVLSFFGAAGRGIPTAGLETMGTVADLITKDTSRNAPGTVLRRKANEFAPPEAAHTADKVIHGLTRFGTKVAVDVGTMGPVAGAVALAIDEGNTTTQNLRVQGVDTATAAKVGAVTGVVSGVGAVLPIAGPTVKATVGLIAAGGPASYVAQEAAAREILQRAGYGEEAAKHDPTDPLGLALSVAIPGFVGGIHIRNLRKTSAPQPTLAEVVQSMESGGRRYGKDGALLTSPKGAQGEMQVMPGTARDPGFGVAPARDGSPDELARVGREYLAAMERRYNDPAQAMAAYNAGPGAVDAAKAKHGAAWLDHMPKETRDYVAKGLRKLGDPVPKEDAAIVAAARTPEAQDAARVRVTTDALARSLPDNPAAHGEVMRAADMVAAGDSVDVLPMPKASAMAELPEAVQQSIAEAVFLRDGYTNSAPYMDAWEQSGRNIDDFTQENVAQALRENSDAPLRVERVAPESINDVGRKVSDRLVEQYQKMRDTSEPPPILVRRDDSGQFSIVEGGHRLQAAKRSGAKDIPVVDVTAIMDAPPQRLFAKQPAAERPAPSAPGRNDLPPPDTVAAMDAAPAARAEADAPAVPAATLARLTEEMPDMPVRLPGSDKTTTLAQALEMAKKEAEFEAGEADLVKAAFECALSFGA